MLIVSRCYYSLTYFITSQIRLCCEVLTEQRTILTLALTPSSALALEAKSLALVLRVAALTPSLLPIIFSVVFLSV